MKPIYAVMYQTQDSYDLCLVGAYDNYQDAYNTMIKDLKNDLMYWQPNDKHITEKEADKIIAEAEAATDLPVLDDFEKYPSLSIEINKDVGKAYLYRNRTDAVWEIVPITEVIKHRDIKEDKNNGQA